MGKIQLTSGFQKLPEGTDIFRIYEVTYDEDFGILFLKFINADGLTHRERYALQKSDGTPNEGAINAFSYMAHKALNDFEVEEIDPSDLVNHYIQAEIVYHEVPSRKNPGQMNSYANFTNIESADGFDKEAVSKAYTTGTPDPNHTDGNTKNDLDLENLF